MPQLIGFFVDYLDIENQIVKRKIFTNHQRKLYKQFLNECEKKRIVRGYGERWS